MKNTKSASWLTIFNHPLAAISITLIFVHQICIASATYFLTKLIENFQSQKTFKVFLFLYIFSMIFPYIPGCLAFVSSQAWINKAHVKYIAFISSKCFGLTTRFRDTSARESVESLVARNSFSIITDYVNFLHNCLTIFLNSLLSLLVLGILLPSEIFFGYVISTFLCAIAIFWMKNPIYEKSKNSENAFIHYGDVLSGVWDNASIGNAPNFNNWKIKVNSLGEIYYKKTINLQLLKQSNNIFIAGISLLPTCLLVIYLFTINGANSPVLAAVIVSFTRIFQVLGSLSAVVYSLLEWSSMNARMKILLSASGKLDDESLFPTHSSGPLTLNEINVSNFDDVIKIVAAAKTGRFTVRGANGSGKSTLLYFLKYKLGRAAVLIPAHHGKLEWREAFGQKSTGQRTIAQLEELVSYDDVDFLLLDEWDANLDCSNKKKIDEFIGILSMDKIVIEVRH